MRAWLHDEFEKGMVLELIGETANDNAQLSLFVQQSGALFFQAQTWNDPARHPGCSWVSIAIDPKSVRVREKRGFFQRLFAWAERVTRPGEL